MIGSLAPCRGTRQTARAWKSTWVALVILAGCATPSAPPIVSGPPTSTVTAQQTSAAEPSPTRTASAASATPAATATPQVGLTWSEPVLFGGDGESFARDVVSTGSGYVAVGTEYESHLPNLGPAPPHQGRVWTSVDGSAWDDATPGGVFDNVSLEHLFTTSDGALRAIGTVSEENEHGQTAATGIGMWESPDGSTWAPVPSPFGEAQGVQEFDEGSRGMVALVHPASEGGSDVWYSADGRVWEQVLAVNGALDVDAGDEGFVVSADTGDFDAPQAYVAASGDGIEWIEASAPPAIPGEVAPLAGDWVAVEGPPYEGRHEVDIATSRSANGLEWTDAGTVPRGRHEPDSMTRCYEYVAEAIGVGPWVVVNTIVSFPCSEGGFVTHGTQWISSDGASWEQLPFPSSLPELRGGSAVLDGAPGEGQIVLVGQSNLKAAIWLGVGNPPSQ